MNQQLIYQKPITENIKRNFREQVLKRQYEGIFLILKPSFHHVDGLCDECGNDLFQAKRIIGNKLVKVVCSECGAEFELNDTTVDIERNLDFYYMAEKN